MGDSVYSKAPGRPIAKKAQEYHDTLKAALWERERLGIRLSHFWTLNQRRKQGSKR